MQIPKFHDRNSLYLGAFISVLAMIAGIMNIVSMGFTNLGWNILIILVGLVLCIHCLDMVKIYRKHRIIKIVKTYTSRYIYKDIKQSNKLICAFNAFKIVWKHPTFRVWFIICSIGILLGLIANIGMTTLVILVAIACLGWAMETANTSIETLMDIINPAYSEKVKIVKDLFGLVPVYIYSAYIITWLILVAPSLLEKVF